jgi:hypothetical protein
MLAHDTTRLPAVQPEQHHSLPDSPQRRDSHASHAHESVCRGDTAEDSRLGLFY